MKWNAVFAGVAISVGLWLFLLVLGVGLGLTAVDTDDAGNLKGIGIGTGIWSIIAPLIAMFIGAFIAGRMCGSRSPRVGATHGLVMWSIALVLGVWSVMSIVSTLANGVAGVAGTTARATSEVVGKAAGGAAGTGDALTALGIDTNDMIAPINKRLADEGKPQVNKDQLEDAIRSVAQRAVREGRMDRELLVTEVARQTNLSRADAEDIATRVSAQYDRTATNVNQRVDELKGDAKDAALNVADKLGKVLFAASMMMLAALLASLGGGYLGARQRERTADVTVNRVDPTV